MFDKMMVRGLLTMAVTATLLIAVANAQVILPTGLAPGSQYQLLLVTSGETAASSTSNATYNSFVTQQVDQNPTLAALGATWTAVITTPTIQAWQVSNTTTIPIYDTHGDLLEPNFPSLFTDDIGSGPQYDQDGDLVNRPHYVWTGLVGFPDWTEYPPPGSGQMGSGAVTEGAVGGGDLLWMSWGETASGLDNSIYAISSPITVVPEPATLSLLFPALLGVGVVYFRRRRAKAWLPAGTMTVELEPRPCGRPHA